MILVQQLGNNVLKVITHGDAVALWVRENDLALADQHAQAMVVLMHEGWTASCHFVYQDAEGPPVDGESVTLHV